MQDAGTARVQPHAVHRRSPISGAGLAGWQVGGQGLRDARDPERRFRRQADGDRLLAAVLPAGCFTNALSDKLNGTLRSPVLPPGKKYDQLPGHWAAQQCGPAGLQQLPAQLQELPGPDVRPSSQWITFTSPDDREVLRTYAELMTMFDNPKFPDQLRRSAATGRTTGYPGRRPRQNPRSYFGVTRVVLPRRPRAAEAGVVASASAVRRAGADDARPSWPPATQATIGAAVQAWADDHATDDDVRWLDGLLRRGLLANRITLSPRAASLWCDEYRRLEWAAVVAAHRRRAWRTAAPGYRAADLRARRLPAARRDGPARATRSRCPRGIDAVRRAATAAAGSSWPSGSPARDNPLTARVMVNRVWHHLFGAGLVRTVDDFGHVGELPSHPELLDYLAARFVEDGWSMKRLIRAIVLTRAFQLSSRTSSAAPGSRSAKPPAAALPARRMEAEAIRDAILAASGRLDRTLYGMSIQPYREKDNADRRLFPGPLDGDGRRSIYIKNNLMEPPKFLGAFNSPGGKVTQGRRDVTNVPAQALALLNDPFVLQQAGVWAQHLLAQAGRLGGCTDRRDVPDGPRPRTDRDGSTSASCRPRCGWPSCTGCQPRTSCTVASSGRTWRTRCST